MKSSKIFILLLFNLIYQSEAIGASTIPTDSTALVSRPAVSTKVQCTGFIVNDTSATFMFQNAGTFDPSTQCVNGDFGLVLSAPGMGGGGGKLGVKCPDDHPFVMSYQENWGAGLGLFAADTVGTKCCIAPSSMKVATQTEWRSPPTQGEYNHMYNESVATEASYAFWAGTPGMWLIPNNDVNSVACYP